MHDRGPDFAAGIWVIDPLFMLDAIHEQLKDADDAPAREQAYFSGARLDDDQLRPAADEDRRRRAGQRARQAEATASSLALGHDIRPGLIDPAESQLRALTAIVCHLLAGQHRDVIAYGAGWTDPDRQQPSATPAGASRASSTPSSCSTHRRHPHQGARHRAHGPQLHDALPGGDSPLRTALWEFARPMLSPRPVALDRDAFVVDDGPQSTVDLAAQRGESGLADLDLGDEEIERREDVSQRLAHDAAGTTTPAPEATERDTGGRCRGAEVAGRVPGTNIKTAAAGRAAEAQPVRRGRGPAEAGRRLGR